MKKPYAVRVRGEVRERKRARDRERLAEQKRALLVLDLLRALLAPQPKGKP